MLLGAEIIIPVAALLISMAAFAASRFDHRHSTHKDRLADLQERVEECERDRTQLQVEVRRLRDVELDLLRRVFNLERGNKP